MRILVDSGNYLADNDNLGDRAVFQMVGRRLLGLWPDAWIRFVTGNSRLVEETHAGLRPLVLGPAQWREDGAELTSYFEELTAADLVVATGGGYYSDAFAEHALGVLNTLEAACRMDKPAVMMSAGFELVRDEHLLARARSLLPRLALIACREGTFGPAYLLSLGVQPERVVVTGDDSVELAYEMRQASLGDAIGVSLRQAPYAGIDDSCLDVLGKVLADAGARHQAPLVPVPISLHGPSDPESIAKLLGAWPMTRASRTAAPVAAAVGQTPRSAQVNTVMEMLREVSRCRLVVTGTYHAAVFALSQGIPVIAIADSLHYRTKLEGLAGQFGGGCTLLEVRDAEIGEKLAAAIDAAWARAEGLRPSLLAAAVDQIAAGQAAYRRLPGLVQPQERDGAGGASRAVRRQTAEVWLRREALSAVNRERDALQHICEERAEVIKSLQEACDVRLREIEKITAEAQRRDDLLGEQAAALAELRQVLDERTAWAERMVREAEQRGAVINDLQAAVDEQTVQAERLTAELEERGVVIAELQAALSAAQAVAAQRARARPGRLLRRAAGQGAAWWSSLRARSGSVRLTRPR